MVGLLGRPFVKRFALCYRSVVSVMSVCLSVTFVHCGQTVGWIKTKLGVQVGLGPGHIVLDGDPAPPPPKGHSPPNFRPISVAAKWLHGSRCHLVWSYIGLVPGDFVLNGDPVPLPKRGAEPQNFWPMFIAVKRLDG